MSLVRCFVQVFFPLQGTRSWILQYIYLEKNIILVTHSSFFPECCHDAQPHGWFCDNLMHLEFETLHSGLKYFSCFNNKIWIHSCSNINIDSNRSKPLLKIFVNSILPDAKTSRFFSIACRKKYYKHTMNKLLKSKLLLHTTYLSLRANIFLSYFKLSTCKFMFSPVFFYDTCF